MRVEFDNIGGPFKVTIIKQDGCNVGRIRKELGNSWMLKVRDGMPWVSTFETSIGFPLTNVRVFNNKREAVDFAKDFFDNAED